MKENPQSSIAEIRVLLSQALDGALDPEQMIALDQRIAEDPEVKAEFLKMQALRDLLRQEGEKRLQYTKVTDTVWQNIERQLQQDQQAEPLAADPEFISAYYDGEIASTDPAFIAFEQQLYGNAEASRMLADIGQISDTVRHFAARLEESCTLDVTTQVMAAYYASEGVSAPPAEELGAVDATTEMVSAYVDQELSAREVIEANRLIEGNEQARQTLNAFTRISERIQSICQQLQAQAPDLWPAVLAELQKQAPAEVIPLDAARSRMRRGLRIAIPVAAAAMLLMVMVPNLQPGRNFTANGLEVEKRSGEQRLAMATRQEHRELAAVPSNGVIFASSASGGRAPMPDAPRAYDASTDAMPASAPLLEPQSEPKLAMYADEADMRRNPQERTAASGKPPSSEEYLFRALSEQMPDEDISAILGQ